MTAGNYIAASATEFMGRIRGRKPEGLTLFWKKILFNGAVHKYLKNSDAATGRTLPIQSQPKKKLLIKQECLTEEVWT